MHLSVGEVKGTNWEKSADVGTKLGERALKPGTRIFIRIRVVE